MPRAALPRALLGVALLGSALVLAGCGARRPPRPAAAVAYVVGAAYRAGTTWYYPREDFRYEATGLAEVLPDRAGTTADGEAFDPGAMAAAHQTLQLPCIARVTNLDAGLQVLVRINDRGPASPARLLGLTRHAADRLGMAPGQVARVRMQVQDGPSQALRDQLQGPQAGVIAAPRAEVAAEPLLPPPGVGQSARGRIVRAAASAPAAAPVGPAPTTVPDQAERVPVLPGQLWIRAGEFGQAGLARQVQARLAGLPAAVESVSAGRSRSFRVRVGPFAGVAAADAALDRAMTAGVTDARIVVE